MKNTRKYIKEAELHINNVFETIDKKLKDYRIEYLKIKQSKDFTEDTLYRYVQKAMYSIMDDLIGLEFYMDDTMYKTQESIEKFGKEHYSNEYASRYLDEATKKLKMYTDIFESYRPELKEAERYLLLLELNGGEI